MLQDIIVIDDFFKDPDSIMEFANQQVFVENDFEKTKSYWQGLRTKELHSIDIHRTNKITNEFFDRIFINQYKLTYKWKALFCFHRLSSLEKFNYKWIHTDSSSVYAGVVYLSKNPVENSGTFIIKNNKVIPIENIYNRLLLYKSNYIHSPMSGFGEDENSRLTLTMFINAISIELGMTNDKT